MKFPVIGLAVMAASMVAGCGPNLTATPTSPTTPPAQSPFISRVGGFYNGSLALSRVTGGECVGEEYQSTIGFARDDSTVVISQTNTDVTAMVRSATTGLSCRYQGTAGPGAFALNTQKCEVSEILFRCANGASRVVEQIGSTFTATVNANAVTGTVTTFFNVWTDSIEAEERRPVAGLILEEQFTAVRR
jgi:hypothetical protein